MVIRTHISTRRNTKQDVNKRCSWLESFLLIVLVACQQLAHRVVEGVRADRVRAGQPLVHEPRPQQVHHRGQLGGERMTVAAQGLGDHFAALACTAAGRPAAWGCRWA